jgi:hypothetical protein
MSGYRLLKVVCQAVLVLEDDDGNLVEQLAEPIAVTAREWPTYPHTLLAQIAGLTNGKDPAMTDTTPTPEPTPEPATEPSHPDTTPAEPEPAPAETE